MSRFLLCALLTIACAQQADSKEPVDYAGQVKPLLKARCYACHGALKQEADLRLDTVQLILQGSENGDVVEPADSDRSALIERVSAKDESIRMPPEGDPLSAEQILLLRTWIAGGAQGIPDERPESDPLKHWSFIPPVRPALPTPPNATWSANPIDTFIAAGYQNRGLTPLAAADKATLLRRIYLDLIGIPPTREQLLAFLADDTETAYGQVVDSLLSSPQHGERWGRHWMDVWRYSDWYGRRSVNDVRNSYPHIWRWRDWIVRSLNEDKPYNRMAMEMLAADEIAPEDDDAIVALGFIVRNWYSLNYDAWMKDLVEHTGKAFLGLRLNCAHCHDHKYDPLSQEDYFRFRAFFEPLELRHDRVPGGPALDKYKKYSPGSGASLKPIVQGLARVFDDNLAAETYMYRLGDARDRFENKPPVVPGIPTLFAKDQPAIEPITLPPTAWYPGLKPWLQQQEIAARRQAIAEASTAKIEANKNFDERLAEHEQSIAMATDKLESAKRLATHEDYISPLAGKQSLLMNASTGRSVLANPLASLAVLEDQSSISFRLKILRDAHTNFQLGLDIAKGLTGGYVAFEQGNIVTYRPGGFTSFTAGNYAESQHEFEVRIDLTLSKNEFKLTIKSICDGVLLVDHVPAALNGWNPNEHVEHGIFIDARTGTEAIYDDIVFADSTGRSLLSFDFEDVEIYAAGRSVANRAGWLATQFSVAPATAEPFRLIAHSAELKSAQQQLKIAERGRDSLKLHTQATAAGHEAAIRELASLQARIDADRAQYVTNSNDATQLIQLAISAERQAATARVEADLRQAEYELADAEAMSSADEKRAAQIQAASNKVSAAKQTVAKVKSEQVASYTPLSPAYPRSSSGRRRALAEWIGSDRNPLTARVAVNHIWMRHFGKPLVESVFDFGRAGDLPTHPDLLDWLAVELIQSGWSMKHLHRLIVTSNVYRLSSGGELDEQNRARDKDNRYLWRFDRRRLEAEAIRDSVLHCAGQLDLQMGGHELDAALEHQSTRRSIYFTVFPEAGGMMQFLDMFDAPDPGECYRRTESIVPQQALAMANSELMIKHSRHLAREISAAIGKLPAIDDANAFSEVDNRFVIAAFEQLLSRRPMEREVLACNEFLTNQRDLFSAELQIDDRDAHLRSYASLIRVLFNHNDFLTLR